MPYNVRLANDAETIKVVDLLFHIWQSVFGRFEWKKTLNQFLTKCHEAKKLSARPRGVFIKVSIVGRKLSKNGF